MTGLFLAWVALVGSGVSVGIAGLRPVPGGRSRPWIPRVAAWGAVFAALAGLASAVPVLLGAPAPELRLPWSVPLGEFHLALDPLSAWFLVPVCVLSAATAVYGMEYWGDERGHGSAGGNPGWVWLAHHGLVASLMLVLVARNALLFLVAWEVMAIASFLLVTHDDEDAEVRSAGWVYLVATHVGTAFLLALFLGLGQRHGGLDFGDWALRPEGAGAAAGGLFLLGLVGFGTKAGIMPLHVWLPEAHPAAPSPVSALMSAVMIKMGVYGLFRVLTFVGPPVAWWGWTLLGLGLMSAVVALLFALAQHDLKRALAYSSIENIGLILAGMGLGVLGVVWSRPGMVLAGFTAALLHVWNHACFKGLLFLGAGTVVRVTGTRQIDRLGGLLKRLPWTGATFLVGAVAICGLPPLNGFISELLLLVGGFRGVLEPDAGPMVAGLLTLAGLGLIGGLAVALFSKLVGMVFLGEPRTVLPVEGREAGGATRASMLLLAGGCGLLGLGAPAVLRLLDPVQRGFTGIPVAEFEALITPVVGLSLLLLAFVGGLIAWRRGLLAGRVVAQAGTWDCGYAAPTPRMQYTGSSFAEPITRLFASVLRTRVQVEAPTGWFPRRGRWVTETPDLWQERVLKPVFGGVAWLVRRLRWLQHGRVQWYVLYLALTLLGLLIWKLR